MQHKQEHQQHQQQQQQDPSLSSDHTSVQLPAEPAAVSSFSTDDGEDATQNRDRAEEGGVQHGSRGMAHGEAGKGGNVTLHGLQLQVLQGELLGICGEVGPEP